MNGLGIISNSDIRVSAGGLDDSKQRMIIKSNGDVGIGTPTPDEKLTVNGAIHGEEVRVDVNVPDVPDYVFEKDYKLLSLSDLERYIVLNKHLPEVPSALEMEAEGLKLKEMNLILLKKVEELSLYMIELKKEIELLKDEKVDDKSIR